ncbi:MAG: hypothetical protein COT89_00200 [Candidatus Colwellbacteria bacterium CG10_big_fil_rev_8_21_14_0_10_42_22]|uniref:Uncharacterized protein n=1 Tax=Candidatus Colwellbacteria bacterium CG10_big_fil_rev_8_21_14_0_10_42_22 TaxID=1974540 RepID=A0A2H0VIX3_9BACT|nr:MAG: hypothetical protein COT89_00200 [Candidatus Colwellbacteria bacterium CG10_big_fil_rev_8_21_14_0_10_42_22]
MKEEYIIKQLNSLKNIEPGADYAASSKLKLLYETPQKPRRVFLLSQSLSTTLSIGLAIVLFVFIGLGSASNIFRNPLSPTFTGVNQELTSEAGKLSDTIDIHLEEVRYLTDVTTNPLVRANIQNVEENNSTDEEIDDLLDEAFNL